MADLLRMSEATALGLHAMVSISARTKPMQLARLADELCASEAHLSKVMQRLVRAGLLSSRRGRTGGYALARPAEEISLLDVYQALEGPMRRDACLFSAPVCDRVHCVLGDLVERVRSTVYEELRSTSLADAEERSRRR
jgi:Rrf2 family nitric oxide-sensitive transcriptional repressor